jgi:hypothetical protein
MKSYVYMLEHVHEFEDGREEVKTIGIYKTEKKAKSAIDRLSSVEGFRDCKDGFLIDRYELDEDNWAEGYVTGKVSAFRNPDL